ncbi:MAG: ATP-grasp domain-containing protein [Candidatus Thermoplasmatota archaeon]|nr:ATP-grasp domain-containing protein [Candidatus Thermoplasmatota archaeon]
MRLYECQGKELFSRYGISVPEGTVVEEENELQAVNIQFPWVMKAQVLTGKRKNFGGIKFASGIDEANKIFDGMMGMEIDGYGVKKILVEEKLDIEKEFYLAVTIDRSKRKPLIMFSRDGGMDIESVDESNVIKIYINPLAGIQNYQLRKIGNRHVADIAKKIYSIFIEKECELVEINPLAYAKGGLIAVDSKVIVNDDALFRHPDLPEENEELTPLEKEARKKNITFVQLDGNIGVIANGAGLTMATLDALDEYGGKGMFLDLGGTDDPEKVKQAFRIIKKAGPDVIFLNLFGGMTKCDTVASGVKAVIDEEGIDCPVVARIRGMHEENAMKILKDKVIAIPSFREAAKKASELGRK